jgi:hypothetical protein
MKRREFLLVLSGTAMWPLTARAQHPTTKRRIGILHDFSEDDPEGRAQIKAFRDQLAKLGWRLPENQTQCPILRVCLKGGWWSLRVG